MTDPRPIATQCARCGSATNGRFCSQCGAPVSVRRCAACQADLTGTAKFCHRCGTAVVAAPGRTNERTAWTVAVIVSLASVAVVGYLIGRGNQPAQAVASMGNAGNAPSGLATRAPDISSMSPRERFDRLFLRVAESQSSDTILMFAPMALGAYQQLDQVDTDARFHAAIVHLLVGEFAAAKALADTIAKLEPTHLFTHVIRGEAAEQERDSTVLAASYRAFLAGYDAEMKADRREYREHQPILEQFKARALTPK